jgi:hypothetical protein
VITFTLTTKLLTCACLNNQATRVGIKKKYALPPSIMWREPMPVSVEFHGELLCIKYADVTERENVKVSSP